MNPTNKNYNYIIVATIINSKYYIFMIIASMNGVSYTIKYIIIVQYIVLQCSKI